jgi:hypothetical protein
LYFITPTFFWDGGILSPRYIYIYETAYKFWSIENQYDLFLEKNVLLLRRPFPNFLDIKIAKKVYKMKENASYKIALDIVCQSKPSIVSFNEHDRDREQQSL